MGEFDVALCPEEQAICEFIAERRYDNKRKGHVEDKRYINRKNLDLYGFGAEMAFCKWENVYPDFAIHNYAGGLDAVDKWGRRVDVKWSGTDYLLAPVHKKRDQCDVFVLIKGNYPIFTIVGWLKEEELLDASNLGNWFNKEKKSYRLHKDVLRKMWTRSNIKNNY